MKFKSPIHLKTKYIDEDVKFVLAEYQNGGTALIAVSGYEQHKLSVNLPSFPLPREYVFIKSYSENEGVLEALLELGIVTQVKAASVQSRYVSFPLCKICQELLDEKA